MMPERALNEHAKRLEKAIHHAMLHSPDIKEILCELKNSGLTPDVWLIMGVSIAKKSDDTRSASDTVPVGSFKLSPEDQDFIRSIKVRWNTSENE